MKFNDLTKGASVVALAAMVSLTGCGTGSDNAAVVAGSNGYYGNSTITGNCNGGVGASVGSPISFQINNAYYDSANIVAGAQPMLGYQSVGQTQAVGNGTINATCGNGNVYCGQSAWGQVMLGTNVQGSYGGSYPYNNNTSYNVGSYYGFNNQYNMNTINLTGSILASGQMMSEMGYGSNNYGYSLYGYNGYSQNNGLFTMNNNYISSSPCVTNVAVNLGHRYGTLYGGQVFLYINGSSTSGYVLQF